MISENDLLEAADDDATEQVRFTLDTKVFNGDGLIAGLRYLQFFRIVVNLFILSINKIVLSKPSGINHVIETFKFPNVCYEL